MGRTNVRPTKKAPKGALSYERQAFKERAGHRENCRPYRFPQVDENHAGCPAGAVEPGLDVREEGVAPQAAKEKAPGGALVY